MPPTLVRPQTFAVLQQPDSASPAVRFQPKLTGIRCLNILPSRAFPARTLYIQSIGLDQITAFISEGTKRDTILYSVGANAVHGLRRTSADKQRAVMTLLQDREWSEWSDREIARRCGVHHQMVGKLRSSLDDSSSERTYTTKHGTIAKMKTARANKKAQLEEDVAEATDSVLALTSSETTNYLHSDREDNCSDSTEMQTSLIKIRENISGLCASLCKSVEHLSLAQAQLIAKALTRRWSLEELLRIGKMGEIRKVIGYSIISLSENVILLYNQWLNCLNPN